MGIGSSNVSLSPCLLGLLDDVTSPLLHASSSDSIIMFAKLHNKDKRYSRKHGSKIDVMIKLAPTDVRLLPTGGEDALVNNSLSIERQLYMHIQSNIAPRTPHIASGIVAGSCTDDVILFEGRLPQVKERWMELRLKAIYDSSKDVQFNTMIKNQLKTHSKPEVLTTFCEGMCNNIEFIVVEKLKQQTLHDYLEHKSLPEQGEFDFVILAQIAQVLLILQEDGIMHNDLHLNNVFIEEFDTPRDIYYNAPASIIPPGKNFAVLRQCRFQVKIFDFDRGAIAHSGQRNNLLEYLCERVGECNQYTENFDWYTFISCFIEEMEVIRKVPYKDYFHMDANAFKRGVAVGKNAYKGKPCVCMRVVDGECVECIPNRKVLRDMISPGKFLLRILKLRSERMYPEQTIDIPFGEGGEDFKHND